MAKLMGMKTLLLITLIGTALTGCASERDTKPEPVNRWENLSTGFSKSQPYLLTEERALKLARLSLDCVDRQYPSKQAYVMDGDETVKPPKDLIPAFYGCFDWHSAVHGHWALVRVLKKFPRMSEVASIRATLSAHLSLDNLQKELGFFQAERNAGFERPYGWGWFLRLVAEVWDSRIPEAQKWKENLKPLAEHLSKQSISYFNRLSFPVREGTHQNTAFAMLHMLDYARKVGDPDLAQTIEKRARDFFLADRNCPIDYEPSGEDFISPCLIEADLMRRLLPGEEFLDWLDRFLPPPSRERFESWLMPAKVRDLEDGKLVHLVGLSLQRAWSLIGVASGLPDGDARKEVFEKIAGLHRDDAFGLMSRSGYEGQHWLASFAIYLLTDVGVF